MIVGPANVAGFDVFSKDRRHYFFFEDNPKAGRVRRILTLLAAAFIPVGTAVLLAQEKGGEGETGPYDLVANWPQPVCGAGHTWGSAGGIFAERPDRVSIFQRGCLPEIKDTGRGAADSFIPSRNASWFDLLQRDASRHPRWDNVLYIVSRSSGRSAAPIRQLSSARPDGDCAGEAEDMNRRDAMHAETTPDLVCVFCVLGG